MVERSFDWEVLLLAVVVTIGIIGGILLVGQQLSDHKVDSLRNQIRDLEVEQRSEMLGLELAQNVEGDTCQAMQEWVSSSTPEIRDLRKRVAAYESSRKLENPEYPTLKKRYTNLILQNLVEVRKMEEECNKNVVDIVYFYSKDCESCEDQGTVLTYYRRNHPEKIIVYPLDTDLDMKPINFMTDLYNITDYPAMIIDGKVYKGFKDRQELGQILDSKLNNTETNSTEQ